MSSKARELRFFWVAFYEEDIVFPQFDLETGEENLFDEIEQDRVIKFGIFSISPIFGAKMLECGIPNVPSFVPRSYVVHLTKGDKLVYLRRNAIQVGMAMSGEMKELNREIMYILGTKKPVGRGWRHSLMFVNEDGDVILNSNFNFVKTSWS